MHNKTIFRALNFVFFGIAILLVNFDVFDFKWYYFTYFPAIILIYVGLMIVVNYFKEKEWVFIVKIMLFISFWGLVFLQLSPFRLNALKNNSLNVNFRINNNDDIDYDIDDDKELTSFSQVLTVLKDTNANIEQNLSIDAGVLSLNIKDSTANLVEAKIKGKGKNLTYGMEKLKTDSISTIEFKPKRATNQDKMQVSGFSEVQMKLNADKIWNIKANGGVGSYDLDFSKFKVKTFDFNGGASSLEVKFSDLTPETHIDINSGVASIEIKVPKNAACQIESEGALSSTSFDDFNKISSGLFRTDNFQTATSKIYIHFQGGLSSFKVKRY